MKQIFWSIYLINIYRCSFPAGTLGDTTPPTVQNKTEQIGAPDTNLHTHQRFFRYIVYFLLIPIIIIYTIFVTLFFTIINLRKRIVIICLALLIILVSIILYFTVFHHHPKNPIKIGVSSFNVSRLDVDVRTDRISYNITVSLNVYNLHKSKYLKIKPTITLWYFGTVLETQIISPIFVNGTVSQDIILDFVENNMYFNTEHYISTKYLNMYLVKLHIKAYSARRPSRISTYALKVGCSIVDSKAVLFDYNCIIL